jgi:5-methylcytosine-specific restriction protein A
MPTRPPKPCAQPGCPALTHARFCPAHQRDRERERGSAAARGYDADWRRFRAWFLARHPICDEGPEPATEVDHIVPIADAPELRFVESNCRPKCKSHHSARTAREQSFGWGPHG